MSFEHGCLALEVMIAQFWRGELNNFSSHLPSDGVQPSVSDLHFYTHPMSRGRIVRWMLEEIGEVYETTILDFETSLKSDEYRQINPMMKVPAIKHGEVVVTECAAICAYLADAFPEKGLAPPFDQRGAYYRWLFFAAGPLEQSCITVALGHEVPADREGMVGFGTLARVLDTLETLLRQSEYVTGDEFSAADVYLAAQLQWNMSMGVVERREAFVDYTNRTHGRPASIRAMQIDDDWIAEHQSR